MLGSKTEKTTPLWAKMLIGIFMGAFVGWALSPHGLQIVSADLATDLAGWIALPGAVFMGLIKMVVLPLVVCSIVMAIVDTGDMSYLREKGAKVLLYFVATTTVAVTIGIVLATLLQPGAHMPSDILTDTTYHGKKFEMPDVETRPSLPEMLKGLIPTNPAKAVVNHSMLHIVLLSLIFGIALLSMSKKQAKPMVDLCRSGQELSMVVIKWAMYLAPIAVFSFLCNLTIKLGIETLSAMSYYILAVIAGLLAVFCMYMMIVTIIGGVSPITFLRAIRDAQILAFSSSSSAATMPTSMRVAEENLKLRPEISRFIIPLGTTINMDGTAIYQIIAALFLCQVMGIDLSLAQTILLSITIIGASIGSPGTPGVGLVILATILSQIGVSAEGVALILGVDRLLDMCRTTINVTGDLTAATVMNKWMKK